MSLVDDMNDSEHLAEMLNITTPVARVWSPREHATSRFECQAWCTDYEDNEPGSSSVQGHYHTVLVFGPDADSAEDIIGALLSL